MAEGPRRLDGYLSELRARLRNLPDAEASEILEELRSHVCDSVGTGGELTERGVAAALERLGSPAELASLYKTDSLLVRAGRSRSPWLLSWSLFRWATVSVAGGFALLVRPWAASRGRAVRAAGHRGPAARASESVPRACVGAPPQAWAGVRPSSGTRDSPGSRPVPGFP